MKTLAFVLILSSCLALSACANGKRTLKDIQVTKGDSSDVIKAVKKPIYDTNLIQREIPKALLGIKQVYQAPSNCQAYAQELAILDQALGKDLTDTKFEGDDSLTINLSQAISRSLTPSIPLSSLVKSLSGAKKHELKRLNAIFRGKSRRSFIKGWASGQGCQ